MKQGYHAIYSYDFYEGIDDARKAGFDFVQFDLGVPKFFLNNLTIKDLKEIRNYAISNCVEITFHSPGDNVSLYCDYPLIRKGILDEFKLILEKANILKARHITFHAGEYPRFKKSGCNAEELYLSYYEQILYENLKCLIDNSGDILICIENSGLNKSKRDVIKKLIEDKNSLYLTLDTAKMYNGKININNDDYTFFSEYKDSIREMHIHDMNKKFGSHQIVGTGTVDFELFKQFYNNNVYINHEVRPVEAAKKSKDFFMQIWDI